MKLVVFENQQSNERIFVEDLKEDGIVIYRLLDKSKSLVDSFHESNWNNIDRYKAEGKLVYKTTIRVFHRPWRDLFLMDTL